MCGAWREDTSSLLLLNPSLPPPQAWASPISAAQTLGAFTTAEALLELPGAWPGQQGLCKAQDPTLISLPWREPGVSFSKGSIAQTSKGPLRETRSGTCLGMPGQGEGPWAK